MFKPYPPRSKPGILLLLAVWFLVWGICPWSDSLAAAEGPESAHPLHDHHEADDTHHASKGAEHSCSGSISFTKNDLKADQTFCQSLSGHDPQRSADPAIRLIQDHGILKPLLRRNVLPKLLTRYYQLYSVYRV